MALLLLLPILVSGFLVFLNHPSLFYRLHRYEGQLLYLQAARYGLYCQLLAFVLVGVVSLMLSHEWPGFCVDKARLACVPPFSTDYLGELGRLLASLGWVKEKPSRAVAFLMLSGLAAVSVPGPWAMASIWLLKRKLDVEKRDLIQLYLLHESIKHSPVLTTLLEAFSLQQEVMISMSDRKVYVGFILSVGAPNEVVGIDQDIQLLPSISGYRDKDTLKVSYTTEYSSIAQIHPIFLRQENILSVSLFSQEILAASQQPHEPREASGQRWRLPRRRRANA